jgi:hypothetical protein
MDKMTLVNLTGKDERGARVKIAHQLGACFAKTEAASLPKAF